MLAPRHYWNDEYIKTITDWAQQHGVPRAVQRHQKGDEIYMCTLLAGSIKDLPVDSIVHPWDATGIPGALWVMSLLLSP